MGGRRKSKRRAATRQSVNKDFYEGSTEFPVDQSTKVKDKSENGEIVEQDMAIVLHEQNIELTKIMDEQNLKLKKTEAKIISLENKIEKFYQQNTSVINDLSASIKQCKQENTLLSKTMEDLTSKVTLLTTECSDKDAIISQQQDEILEKANIIERLSAALEEAKQDKEEQRKKSIDEMASLLSSNTIQCALNSLSYESIIKKSEEENEEVRGKLSQEQKKTSLLEQKLLETEIDLEKSLQQAAHELSKSEKEIDTLKENNIKCSATIANLQHQISQLQNEKKEISNAHVDEVQSMIKNHKLKISHLEAEHETQLMAHETDMEKAINDLKHDYHMELALLQKQHQQFKQNIKLKHEEMIDVLSNKKPCLFFFKKKIKVAEVITDIENICLHIDGGISLQ